MKTYDAFLSFSSWDREWVRHLHADLERCGFKIYFDEKDLVPGKLYEPQLEQGLTQGHLIFVVSPDSMESSWVSQERTGFSAHNSDSHFKLLPIVLHPTPMSLFASAVQAVDFHALEYAEALRILVGALRGLSPRDAKPLGVAITAPPNPEPRMPYEVFESVRQRIAGLKLRKTDLLAVEQKLGLVEGHLANRQADLMPVSMIVRSLASDTPRAGIERLHGLLVDLELVDSHDEFWHEQITALKTTPSTQTSILTRYAQQVQEKHRDDRLLGTIRSSTNLLRKVYVQLKIAESGSLSEACAEERVMAKGLPGTRLPDSIDIDALLALDLDVHKGISGRWVVCADPGAGKTTMLRHFAQRLAKAVEEDSQARIPIYVSLASWARGPNTPLEKLVEDQLTAGDGLATTLDQAAREQPRGRVVVLLDGLDEVPHDSLDDIRNRLIDLANRWPRTPIVVTTRPIGYLPFSPELFRDVDLLPLDRLRKREFLVDWFCDKGIAEGHLAAIDADVRLTELSGCPLYLTLLALLFEKDIVPSGLRHELYDQVIKLLLEGKHRDQPAMGYISFIRRALQTLAIDMTERDAQSMDLESAEGVLLRAPQVREELESVGVWDKNICRFLEMQGERIGIFGSYSGEWSFWHKSFREALVAEALSEAELLARLQKLDGLESRWAEPIALICGRSDDPDNFLLEIAKQNQNLAMRALAGIAKVRPETVQQVVGLSADEDERVLAYARLPDQIDDVHQLAGVFVAIAKQRVAARESGLGFDLYHLDEALLRLRDSAGHAFVEARRAELWTCVPVPEEELSFEVAGEPGDEFWVTIPGGEFVMGSEDGDDDERPCHRVEFEQSFELARVPVTVAQFAAFDPAWGDKHQAEDNGNHPAAELSWFEAVAFCRWLSRQGREVRLPSEAEWEYACRAGSTSDYWSGKEEADLKRVAWFDENSGYSTHAVGELKANAWGLFDVHGNVREWCQDTWHDSYDAAPADGSAWEDSGSVSRVVRGGGWIFRASSCRSACRNGYDPGWRSDSIGFRPARSSLANFTTSPKSDGK